MATDPAVHPRQHRIADSEVEAYAERLGVSVEEASRILAQKASNSDALSFMPGPEDVASRETYDSWLRVKIQEALDDRRPSLSQEEVEAYFAKRRAAMLASAEK